MRGILKNTLLLLGGMALGSLATRRAIRYAVENRYDLSLIHIWNWETV